MAPSAEIMRDAIATLYAPNEPDPPHIAYLGAQRRKYNAVAHYRQTLAGMRWQIPERILIELQLECLTRAGNETQRAALLEKLAELDAREDEGRAMVPNPNDPEALHEATTTAAFITYYFELAAWDHHGREGIQPEAPVGSPTPTALAVARAATEQAGR